jgi:hypothetical protein
VRTAKPAGATHRGWTLGPTDVFGTVGEAFVATVMWIAQTLGSLAPQADRYRFVIAAVVLALLFTTILDRMQDTAPPRRAPGPDREQLGGSPVGSRAHR